MQPDETVNLPIERLTETVERVFEAVGSPPQEAAVIAEELVGADRMGLHSHGCARVGEYVAAAQSGRVVPGGPCTVAHDTPSAALVDGASNYGQVVGRFALDVAARKAAETGVACVVTRRSHHVGRVGSLMERATGRDLISIATVAVGLPGLVAPWGAAEGVLGTNPFAYGVPYAEGEVVTDFATSTSAEGAVRLAHERGQRLPEGILVDADGEPTTDPGALFVDPPGALLPFGGVLGHKGYALNILPELVAAALAGYGAKDPERPSNCLLLVVIDPAAFLPVAQFKALAGESVELIKGARPRHGQRVMLPGERETEHAAAGGATATLARTTVEQIEAAAAQLGVAGLIAA
ncbi:Ldh family oxidoreductase [Conexibacter sp. CPCC 206217]|uniref:Ldh family oxidoreductase n=1 Tax=Conexibacter sp. CPCC 206217 TaxID=3064574 RepID=UPI002726F5E4|nr:Ldh family oxidoreductase [Conexibacter sp. CPCC 206217]MDO8210331.1 Ldh family oxidoreductase [Conexibacter sp. CPCC 206217]